MAITIRDNRIVLNEADTVTGWVSTDGPTVFNTGPTPIEAGGCLGLQASQAIQNAYIPITSDNYSLGGSLFIWMTDRAAFDTTVNGGIGIQVGDNTNRIAYHVGGSDGTAFRHETGPVKWACFQIDLANKPVNFSVLAGAEASLNEAAITQVGVYFETIAKSVGGADNCFWDIIRYADNGVGIEVFGGTVGTPENFEQVSVEDRNEGTLRAHGIIRKVGSGVYSIQGNINIGDTVGTSNTYINSISQTFLWEDRRQSTDNYYRFNAIGNGTGVTNINFDSCIFTCPTSGSINFSSTTVIADVRDTVISGFNQGILTGGSGNVWTNNTYSNCGTLTTTGTNISGGTFTGFTGIADDSQVFWNSSTDPSTNISNCSFTMGAIATHAIEFPTGLTNTTVTVTDIDFIGYSGTNNVNSSVLNFLATTGSITVNVTGGSGTVSYKTAGAIVTIVSGAVSIDVTAALADGTPVVGARVFIETNTGIGNLPYQNSVTITRSGTTASVSHTGHGLSNGDQVVIRRADQNAYNGIKTIFNVTVNAYDFTVAGSPTTPATGTILSSFVFINGLTNGSGLISSVARSLGANQSISGRVRKSTTSPYFKSSPVVGIINASTGLSVTAVMINDD
jgi:hypothetical protein